jgi:TrpR family transcriptional regulator, trp operon repressor
VKKNGWLDFIAMCHHTRSEAELDALLKLLLTLDEQEQLTTRVELLRALLRDEKPQRAISQDLKISIAKITRGSNALKTIGPGLRNFLMKELL